MNERQSNAWSKALETPIGWIIAPGTFLVSFLDGAGDAYINSVDLNIWVERGIGGLAFAVGSIAFFYFGAYRMAMRQPNTRRQPRDS